MPCSYCNATTHNISRCNAAAHARSIEIYNNKLDPFLRGRSPNWFKNGEATTYTGTVLPASATACEDEWYANVVPSDGELTGVEVFSNVVTICGANTAPLWSDNIPMIHVLEDSDGNRFEMAGFVNDSEQAISQLVLSVQGNTNEETISASFQGSQLIVSAISENFYGMSIATLTLTSTLRSTSTLPRMSTSMSTLSFALMIW